MFPPPQLPSSEQFLLITDELAAPADFLLHRILGTHLKDAKRTKLVVLSVSEGLARWKAISAKSVRGQFIRLDVFEIIAVSRFQEFEPF